jgi:hypothetical protein
MAAQNCQQSRAQLLRPVLGGRQASAATRLLSSFPSSCDEIRSAQRLRSCATRITVKTSRAWCRPFWRGGLIARNHNFIITELRNDGGYYPFRPQSRVIGRPTTGANSSTGSGHRRLRQAPPAEAKPDVNTNERRRRGRARTGPQAPLATVDRQRRQGLERQAAPPRPANGAGRAYARTWASRAARAAPDWNAAAIAVTAAPLGTGGSTGKTVCAAGVCGVRTMRQASARRRFMRQKLISAVPVC